MTEALHDWTPLRIYTVDGAWRVDWAWVGDPAMWPSRSGDFYDLWLEGLQRRPFNLLFRRQTGVDALLEAAETEPGLPLAGLILHISHCGSTLAARLLATDPANLVLVEPYLMQQVILNVPPEPSLPDEVRIAWLRALVSVMGRPLAGGERRLFIKPGGLVGLRLDLLLRAFPTTPWVFLYRQPVEVLVAQMHQPGGGTLPGYLDPALLGLDLARAFKMPVEEYVARLLARICAAAVETLPESRGLALNYARLPQAAWHELADHFGLALDAGQVAAMQVAARYNVKSRDKAPFVPDSAAKQRAATPELHRLAHEVIGPCFDRLETLST
jgi:hypothetical protein